MGKENQIGDDANDINLATTRKQRADPTLPLSKTPHQPLHTPKMCSDQMGEQQLSE